jgi:hypothetical protein
MFKTVQRPSAQMKGSTLRLTCPKWAYMDFRGVLQALQNPHISVDSGALTELSQTEPFYRADNGYLSICLVVINMPCRGQKYGD